MSVDRALGRIHITLLVYPIVCGMILLFLSPIRFHLPPWVTNPFSLKPPDIFSSFITIIVCSYCLGFVMYFVKPLITGNDGLNQRLREQSPVRIIFRIIGWGRRQPREEIVELTPGENAKFWKWIHDNHLVNYSNLLTIQNYSVLAFITGAEIAFFMNLLYFSLNPIAAIMFRVVDFPNPFFVTAFFLMILTLIIAITSIFYDRRHFRDSNRRSWNIVKSAFRAEMSERPRDARAPSRVLS